MSEWKTYRLSDLINLLGGGTPKTTVPEYWNGEIPWLSVVDFGKGIKKVYQTEKSITEKGLNESSAKILKEGQIIISARGTVGELAVLGRDMAFNQSCYGIYANEKTENNFLYYLIKYSIGKIKKNTHGAVFDTITKQTFENIEVTIPKDKEIQKEIAQILTSLDDKIELNLQMNQTLEAIAQAIFKEWFVNFNFPGFDGNLVDGLPKGWRIGKLGEVVSFVKGVSYKSSELVLSKFALVTLKSFNRFGGLNYRGFKEFFGKYKETQVLNEGDIIIAQTDITQSAEVIGCPAIVENPFGYEKLIASIDVVKCVPINIHFSEAVLFYFLKDKRFKDFCLSHTNGSTVLHLRSSALPNFEFPLPDNGLLKKFSEIIYPIREKIISNNKQIQTLTQLRDTLLPKLMSGKIKVAI